MGKKLTDVRNKTKEGSDSFKETDRVSKKAVSDVKQIKELLDSLPTDDVDDEIVRATKEVSEGTRKDADVYMKSEVKAKVEAGKKIVDESSKAAREQVQNNEKVKAAFDKMDSVAGFGKGARDLGRGRVEQSTQTFNDAIRENEQLAQNAEQAFQQDLSEISSTF